jgi:hypothetical protein
MKHLVLLTALITLLSCGSDSNLITPNPAQPAEKSEPPVVKNPLAELPEVIAEPPPIQIVIEPPEIIIELPEDPPPDQ